MQACKPDSVSRNTGTLIIYLGLSSPAASIDPPIPLSRWELNEQPYTALRR